MIDTQELTQAVLKYRERCRTANTQPTFKGMASALKVSGQTVANVVHGTFNGRRYTDHEHATRIIRNTDFELLQSLFEERGIE